MLGRSVSLPVTGSITGKENIDTTYGEHNYLKKINQYKLLCPIGEGSFSRVFLAQNTETSQYFAIKRLHMKKLARTAMGVTSLQREIAMMNKLSHPNVVTLHQVIYVKPTEVVYLVLDYADCGNMSGIIKQGHKFTPAEIRHIFIQVAKAVAYLHGQGIVHQDLKPQNILLKHDGTALIADFGVGHSFQSQARAFGTPAFQAPEVIDRSPTDDVSPGKEDVWSLGVTLYYLSFGSFPFTGANVFEIVRSISTTTLKKPNDCDPVLWDLIVNMLTVGVRQRFDIHEVLAHEYVTSAEPVEMNLTPMEIPPQDPTLPVRAVTGIVCGDDFVFDAPQKKLRVVRPLSPGSE